MNDNKTKVRKSKIKKFFFGMQGSDGFFAKFVTYGLLIVIGFVFLYPILYMLSTSLKSLDDLLNPFINWIPSELYLGNYEKAFEVLDFWSSLLQTLVVTIVPSIAQAIVASIVGYGFARFNFRGKNILFVLMLLTFIIPPQVTFIPKYIMFYELGMIGEIWSILLPAIFGQGLNSAIFILIFYQIFRGIPTSLEEAAQLDGASHFTIFWKIAIPMATSGFIITFLFSLVWYWNETFMTAMLLGDSFTTLPLQLEQFTAQFTRLYPIGESGMTKINEGIELAGTLLTILPLLIIYAFTQRWFVESVDRSGIAGE